MTMKPIDKCYLELLNRGLVAIRNASLIPDLDWVRADAEFLHNVPSLIGEENFLRHQYFWNQERQHYMDLTYKDGNESRISSVRTYYVPVLEQIKVHLEESGIDVES